MSSDALPFVYIKSKEHAWIPARVLENDGTKAKVVVQKYKDEQAMLLNSPKTSGITVREEILNLRDYDSGVLPMQNVSDGGKLGDYEDMVNLPYLHEVCYLIIVVPDSFSCCCSCCC